MSDRTFTLVLTLVLCALMLAGSASFGQLVYGDWRCGFAQCRIEVSP